MKKAIRNLQDRVAVVEGQLNTIKSDIDELKGSMSTILKHIGLQRKGDEDVLEKKVDIGLEEPIDVVDDEDVIEIEPFLTQRPHVRPARVQVFTYQPHSQLYLNGLDINHQAPPSQAIVYDPMHKILDVHLDRLRAWITHAYDDECVKPFMGKNRRLFSRLVYVSRWLSDEHLDALFLFIRLKIKARIPSSRTSQSDTIFMRILVSKWPLYKECIKENRPLDGTKSIGWLTMLSGQKWTSKILGQVLITFTLHSMSMATIGFYYAWIW
ncbi:hypothetical protein IC575_022717 [Cucumis melo]